MHDIIDNRERHLVNMINEKLLVSKKARIAVGFLFPLGLKEIKNGIEHLEKLEIITGARVNKETSEILFSKYNRDKAVIDYFEKTKYLNEEGRKKILEIEYNELIKNLSQIDPSVEYIDFLLWLKSKLQEGKIEVRLYYKEPLHSKLYLFEYKDQRYGLGEAIVGSSNLSLSGLRLNTELNVRILGDENYKKLNEWFENLWKESELTILNDLIIKAIDNCWAFNKDVTPFRIYLRVLHEIFSYKEPEPTLELEVELYRFQKDAVIDAYRKLKKFNGVFISDVPGLGKTYIGSALLSHLETEGETAIVIVPPRLVEYWQEVLSDFNVSKAKVFSSGKLDEILDNEKYLKRKVVLIDESHHFRNPDTKKYHDLLKICEDKKVVLLTATPQNLSIWDIYWQLKLFTPYETNHEFRIYPVKLKEYFKKCEEGKANIEDLISQIFIRRTRSDIKEYYPDEKICFPERKGPYRVDYSIDKVYPGSYENLKKYISELSYARYDLSRYAKEKLFDPDELQRLQRAWGNLRKLMSINLHRRLESSVQAFRDTVNTHIKVYEYFKRIILEEGKVWVGDVDELEDIIEKLNNDEEVEWELGENYYEIDKFYEDALLKDLDKDLAIFGKMHNLVEPITPKQDEKLKTLIDILSKNKDKKILIFSCFESTVKYIYSNIKDKFEKVDYIVGGEKILTKIKRFAPKANKAKIDKNEEIKILVTTEILSEGLNLQDAEIVINYELHWNPVRIIQRIGRIDRIGSPNDEVYVYNFFPETSAEKEINVEKRVKQRIEEIIQNFGYDEKTIHTNEPIVRKKLFEIYTENPQGLEEEEPSSLAKSFELEYNYLIKQYPEEFEKAKGLPFLVNIAKTTSANKDHIIVFCRADNYYRLKLANLNGEIVCSDEWEILKLMRCNVNEKGMDFNQQYYSVIKKVREEFEKEANEREREKVEILTPIKMEFKKLITWLKRKEPENIKVRFDNLLNFVIGKNLNYEQEKFIRKISRSYPQKFGLKKEEILKELEEKIYNFLRDAQPLPEIKIEPKYADVIIAEQLI
jgi:superfamily II DNA or RNA helicase